MANTTKKTNSTSIVDEKNSTVEITEKPVAEEKTDPEKVEKVEKPAEKDSATNKKPKEIDDNAKVIIKCIAYAGKSIILPTRTIELDEKGNCEVTGAEAKRLLTIPGYELAK